MLRIRVTYNHPIICLHYRRCHARITMRFCYVVTRGDKILSFYTGRCLGQAGSILMKERNTATCCNASGQAQHYASVIFVRVCL